MTDPAVPSVHRPTGQALLSLSERWLTALDRALARPAIWRMALAFCMAWQLALIAAHRPWVDEWQALLIAVQPRDFSGVLWNLHYEGHAPLWYALLRVCAVVVGPLAALPVLAGIAALVTQGLILLAAPFSRVERVALALSEFVVFESLTLARSLTIAVMLLVLVMVLWRRRWLWVPLALLPLCDFLPGVVSCLLVVLLAQERRLWGPGLALWAMGGLLAAVSVLPAHDLVPAVHSAGPVLGPVEFLFALGPLLLPVTSGVHGPEWGGQTPFGLGALAGCLFLLFGAAQVRRRGVDGWVFVALVAVMVLFSALVYPLVTRHALWLALLLVCLAWRRAGQGAGQGAGLGAGGCAPLSPAMRLWLAVAAGCGLAMGAISLVVPFDRAEDVARFIHVRGLADRHWEVLPSSRDQGVSALTGIRFERPGVECGQSFTHWNSPSGPVAAAALAGFLRQEIARHGRFYLLSDRPLELGLPRDLIQPLTVIPAGLDGLPYHLLVVGPGEAERAAHLPPCVPGFAGG